MQKLKTIKMKKLLTILLILSLCLVMFTACSTSDVRSTSEEDPLAPIEGSDAQVDNLNSIEQPPEFPEV